MLGAFLLYNTMFTNKLHLSFYKREKRREGGREVEREWRDI